MYARLAKYQLIGGVFALGNMLSISILLWLVLSRPSDYLNTVVFIVGFWIGEVCGIVLAKARSGLQTQKILAIIAVCTIATIAGAFLFLDSILFQAAGMILGALVSLYLFRLNPHTFQEQRSKEAF